MPKRLFLFDRLSFFTALFIFIAIFSSVFVVPLKVFALTDAEQEAQWQAELATTEADIAKWQSVLDSTKANTKSLQQG